MKNELKKKLAELENLEKIADLAVEEYEADPKNKEKEAAFDAAYEKEFSAFMAVSNLLSEMTGRQIDEKTARAMISGKRAEIKKLLA